MILTRSRSSSLALIQLPASVFAFVIETHPAVGAKFPRARCRNTALPQPQRADVVIPMANARKILIVDDDLDLHDALVDN